MHDLARLALVLCVLVTETATAGDLVAQALDQGLDRAPQWRALLHLNGLPARSAAQGEHFFQSPRGARDPQAELVATLEALLDPEARIGDEPAACALPARTRWLARALGLPDDYFTRQPCPEFEAWRSHLDVQSLTLIYADAFMGSPASMFGHTLLRLDAGPGSGGSTLLSWAIDFTADTGGESGPIYLVKGTLGVYPGRFAVNPYYSKLKLYAEWQNRDVWEYPLRLRPDEIELLLLHLWELRGVSFPYYFFYDNCSYQLVRLLEVVRPGLPIRHGSRLTMAPIDTVRALVDGVGLAGPVAYRPSPARNLREILKGVDAHGVALAFALARGELEAASPAVASLPETERGRVLGAAYDTLHYWLMTGDVDEDDTRDRAHRLLLARSRAGKPREEPLPPRPAVRPDEGHGTALVAAGVGWREGNGYLELRLRPGFHDLMDPAGGFPEDATIRALDTRLRYIPRLNRVRLEELVFLELRSQAAGDALRKPWSWHVDTGLRTRLFEDRSGDLDPSLVWRTAGGGGFTWARADGRVRAYALLDAGLEAGREFDGYAAFGPGASLGLELATPADRWKGHLYAKGLQFVLGDTGTLVEAGLAQSLRLTRHTALRADVTFHHLFGQSWWDTRLSLERTF